MKTKLRVLMVEDSDLDAHLLVRELTEGGFAVEHARIETEVKFREALAGTSWDLIICDYHLPRFEAPVALKVLQELDQDLPFIVVSGSIATETAVEMMRLGASDYLLKDDLARFVPAVRRELREAESRRERRSAEEALRHAHEELERRVLERTAELTSANERLRELDRLKSEFLATMSHELRTPLNSIIGFTSLVKEGITGPLNEEQRKQLHLVYTSAKHLLGLINDLLDLSRIEAGKVRIETEAFDLAGVVAETLAQIRPLAHAKRLTLRPQLPPGAIPMIGDRRRCLQILLNLAHNAVKFTEKGTIDIVVRIDAHRADIDVIDTGIGIKPDQLANLFEAFRQLDGSARRLYEGTGLGLYLCKKLLNLMKGRIVVHSVFSHGTRISFSLPRQLSSDIAAPAIQPELVASQT